MDLDAAIAQGTTNPLVLIATALVLGALHGLEPGHSKTMMASFVIAVRGTVPQAVLLGLAAAFSHSAVVWVLALAALFLGRDLVGDDMERWLTLGSGVIISLIGVWIFVRTWRVRSGVRSSATAS